MLVVAGLAGCATPVAERTARPTLTLAELRTLNQRLAAELTEVLRLDGLATVAIVMLPFAETAGFAADTATEPDTLASHQLFLLSDQVGAVSPGRTVLRAYEAVIRSARCLPWAGQVPVGCRLLEDAKALFDGTADRAPPFSRPDFPAWKVVAASPPDWSGADAPWAGSVFRIDSLLITAETLYVTLHRPWLLEEFLVSGDWYLAGACRGSVSSGQPGGYEGELLPQFPAGMLLARNLRLTDVEGSDASPVLQWQAPRVIAWVYRRQPLAPRHSDPCRSDCEDGVPSSSACILRR